MAASGRGFAESIRINSSKILEETQAQCYAITDELFRSVVHKTPVLKGELINNWFTSTGDTLSKATTPMLDKSGSGSLLNIESLPQADLFNGKDDTVSMTNNLSWAINAEYLGWPQPEWSGNIGPYSMVRDSLIMVANKHKGE